MKTDMRTYRTLLLIAFSLITADSCLAASLRSVNGKEVDLQPLIDWAADKKGERPLKHWKLVQIVDNKGQSAFQIVEANIEGAKMQIALKNCPAEILGLLAQKQALEARLAAVKQDYQAAAQEAAGAHKRNVKQQAKRAEASDTEAEKSIKKEMA